MNITEQTTEALKALGYDQLAELERIQRNLQLIQAEIAKRTQAGNDNQNETGPEPAT